MSQPDVWGELPGTEEMINPLKIFREQGQVLKDKSKGVLYAEPRLVDQHISQISGIFVVVAPALNKYSATLFEFRYGATMYPVHILGTITVAKYKAENPDELYRIMTDVLSQVDVRKIIASLIAQSTTEIA